MSNYRYLLSSIACLASSLVFADAAISESNSEVVVAPVKVEGENIDKISEAFGHLIGKNIETLGFKFDMEHVIKGLQDAAAGKESPMSETECVQAISVAQEVAFKKQAQENLEKAETFMETNGQTEGIVSLENGKLQYKIEKAGEGEEVQVHFSPLIRYTGKYVDGTVFGSSKEDELISLDETIPGLSKGMIGMKEGEKRVVYIHPELGYGTNGYLPPNSLLTFEIEVVKANAAQPQEADPLTTNAPKSIKGSPEIANPPVPAEAVR